VTQAHGGSLLIEERPLMVLPKLAKAIGLNEAIFLQNLHWWLTMKEQTGDRRTFKMDRMWVYNSLDEWVENFFPFWSKMTVRRVIDSLVERGLVLATALSDRRQDRTLWYTIDYDALAQVKEDLFNMNRSKCSERTSACVQSEHMQVVNMNTSHESETSAETSNRDNNNNNTAERASEPDGCAGAEVPVVVVRKTTEPCPTGETRRPRYAPEDNEAVQALLAVNIERARARELVASYGEERVIRQLAEWPKRPHPKTGTKTGQLILSLVGEWAPDAPPPGAPADAHARQLAKETEDDFARVRREREESVRQQGRFDAIIGAMSDTERKALRDAAVDRLLLECPIWRERSAPENLVRGYMSRLVLAER
jgi:hypothetical protein